MHTEPRQMTYEYCLKKFNRGKYKSIFRVIFQRRKFYAFCVGTPKSGTHSLAAMLSEFRSAHEPDQAFMVHLIQWYKKQQINQKQVVQILKVRDDCNWLELESSHYCGEFVEELGDLSADTKFILTIRDCLSWLDSWFNHQLSRPMNPRKAMFKIGRNNYYDRGFSYTKYDAFLEGLNLFPIKSYLTYWNERNSKVIEMVAPQKLLILKTNEISKSKSKIARFLNIDLSKVKSEKSHQFKAKEKHDILKRIDPHYVFDTAMEVCGDLNNDIFPEQSIDKVLKRLLHC